MTTIECRPGLASAGAGSRVRIIGRLRVKAALIFTHRDFLDALRVGQSGQAMALDGPNGDGTGGERPERFPRHTESGDNGSAVPRAPAELRTRAEYYEVHLAANDSPGYTDHNGGVADGRADPSGWDAIDAEDRPDIDAFHITPERATHILDGDATGGGHRHGTGKPGKTEFPASWDDGKIIDTVLDVARRPDPAPGHQEWNDRWVARGTRDDVGIVAVIQRDGRIWSAWPLPGGAGVIKNPEGT